MKMKREEKYVYSADGEERGELTGGRRRCQMEGCTGERLGVRWPDRKVTYPCTRAMRKRPDGQWQIMQEAG